LSCDSDAPKVGSAWSDWTGVVKRTVTKRDPTVLTLNLPTTTIVAQPFNVIKWQLKFNPVA